MPKSSAIATGPATGHTEKGRIVEISYWIWSTRSRSPATSRLDSAMVRRSSFWSSSRRRFVSSITWRARTTSPSLRASRSSVSCTLAASTASRRFISVRKDIRDAASAADVAVSRYRTGAPPNMYASRLRSSSLACRREARTRMTRIRRSSLSMRSSAATMSDWRLGDPGREAVHAPLQLPDPPLLGPDLVLGAVQLLLGLLELVVGVAELDRATPGRHARTNAATDPATMRWARGTAPRVVRGPAISVARTYLRIRTGQPRLVVGRGEHETPSGAARGPSVPHACFGQGAG